MFLVASDICCVSFIHRLDLMKPEIILEETGESAAPDTVEGDCVHI